MRDVYYPYRHELEIVEVESNSEAFSPSIQVKHSRQSEKATFGFKHRAITPSSSEISHPLESDLQDSLPRLN